MFDEYFREELLEVASILEEETRQLLMELDINASGDLIDSIQFVVDDDNNLMILFADYGLYVDAGQRGTNGAVNSPFVINARGSFRQRGRAGTFTPPRESFTADGGSIVVTYSDIRRWIADRNIIPYGNIDRDGLAFAIQRSIVEEGVRPTNWIADALDNDFVEEVLGEAHARATERLLNDAFGVQD